MTGVLLEMRRTNHLITKEALFHYGEDRSRWALLKLRSTGLLDYYANTPTRWLS